MADLLTVPSRATDANGNTLAGALLYLYQTGTTTLQAGYAESTLVTPLANPVVADSGGKFPAIYLDSSKIYRAKLTDSLGTVVFDIDPYNAPAANGDYTSIKTLGAKGDGSTDNTAAFTTMAATGGTFYVPDGTYLTDYVSISKKVNLILSDGATIKNRVPSSPSTTLDAHWGVFRFVAGSEGSTVRGGAIDGNRASLAPYYNGHTRLGQDNHWWGIRVEADDVTITGTKFANCMNEGFYAYSCDRFRALDVDISNCGVAFAVQGKATFSPGCVVRATARNIGNVISGTAYYLFQHGVTFGNLTGAKLDFTLDGFCASKQGTDGVSTGGGKEPVPIGVNLYLLEGCEFNCSVRNYTTVAGLTSAHQAFNWSSVNNCVGTLVSFGLEQGLACGSSSGNICEVNFDGDYLNCAGYSRQGLILTFGGVYPTNVAGLAGETNSNLGSRDNVFSGTIARFGIGVRDEGEANDLSRLSVFGNVTDGVQLVRATGTSASYPASRSRPSGARLLNGIRVTTNGESGIVYTGGDGDTISNSYVRDSGQTIGGATSPYNLYVAANSGEGVGLRINENDLDATTGATLANEVSYISGTATAKPSNRTYNNATALTHTYQVTMRNANTYRLGEIVKLKAVLSGSTDATGKVVDIDEDIVTLAFSSAVVFDATTSLDTLTGTGATTGTVLTGTGTLFSSEVDFPVYLQKGSEYRRIVFVNSNTSAVLESAFSSDMAPGTALKVVRADVQTGTVAPTAALNVNGNVTTGPMLIRNNVAVNLANVVNFLSFPGIAPGSRYEADYSLAMTGTGLSNAIVTGLAQYSQVRNVKAFCDTAITGTSGTNTIVVKDNTTTLSTPITFSAVTIGTTAKGPCNTNPAFLNAAGGGVYFVSSSGNPTGTIRVRLTIDQVS